MKLKDRLLWLMDEKEQGKRPKADQGKWTLGRGLELWLKRAGPVYVLALGRDGSEPSEQEVVTVTNALLEDAKRPCLVWNTAVTTKFLVPQPRGVRYIVFTYHPVQVTYPPEIKQGHLFEVPETKYE